MLAIVQRVDKAEVSVNNSVVGKTDKGLFILLGVFNNDSETDAEILARKVANLRIFTDENDKMNLSVKDIGGSALVVSNFTLCADIKKGNRPSFINAMEPETANRLYEFFIKKLKEQEVPTESGEFGGDMLISAALNGPITIQLNSETWRK